ncbi:MAG: hypothetical protein HN420_18975, partial [Rhodospirillaceae bacterium]|nr:hypothetical protein [Rhodospirillaceae bacterium]
MVALVGLGLLAGGATGTLASRETGTGQAEAAKVAHEIDATGKTEETITHSEAEATVVRSAPPARPSVKEPEIRIALAPLPDQDRPARRLARLAAAAHADNAAAPKTPSTASGDDAAWQRYAATTPVIDGPMIAIVIDDSGHDIARTKRLAAF